MTTQQIATIIKGVARAHRDGCYIIGKGTIKASGLTVWSVRGKNDTYLVAQLDAHTLTCTCPSHQVCKHRNLVTVRLMEEAKIDHLMNDLFGTDAEEDREHAPMALKDSSRRFLRV